MSIVVFNKGVVLDEVFDGGQKLGDLNLYEARGALADIARLLEQNHKEINDAEEGSEINTPLGTVKKMETLGDEEKLSSVTVVSVKPSRFKEKIDFYFSVKYGLKKTVGKPKPAMITVSAMI